MKNNLKKILPAIIMSIMMIGFLSSCKNKGVSPVTGWEYNEPQTGGFEVRDYLEQETGPGLILIEGGTFAMGRTEQDVMYDWNNIPRRITVSSFYMDETEVRNLDYLEYLYWLQRVYVDFPTVYDNALPDTLVWLDELAYNEPFVQYYLRHPAYREYPVVGVNWLQADEFCNWRTDRVNEYILIREGILEWDPSQQNENNFNTDAYLAGQYQGVVKQDLVDLNPNGTGTRKVRLSDGIFSPDYRLPTEAEWEFAALGLIGNTLYERVIERRKYPWNGHIIRSGEKDNTGEIVLNVMRGRGDYMGVAGNLNDAAEIPAPVYAYWPNDYGLYNMAGNVAEWVADVYRPLSYEDFNDFRPYRGNVFTKFELDNEGNFAEKDTLGRMKEVPLEPEDMQGRRNFRKYYNVDYMDGDYKSSINYSDPGKIVDYTNENQNSIMQQKLDNKVMYQYGVTSLINDKARVYKGGSWKDRVYWATPGARRFLDEEQATDHIGFRCAMTRVGSPIGNYK